MAKSVWPILLDISHSLMYPSTCLRSLIGRYLKLSQQRSTAQTKSILQSNSQCNHIRMDQCRSTEECKALLTYGGLASWRFSKTDKWHTRIHLDANQQSHFQQYALESSDTCSHAREWASNYLVCTYVVQNDNNNCLSDSGLQS